VPFVLLLPVFAGAGAVVVVYAFLRELAVGRAAAITAAAMFATGTIHWKYSTVLYSHALSALLILLSLYLAVRIRRQELTGGAVHFLVGLLLGYAVLVEYSNALLVLIVSIYLLWQPRLRDWPAWRTTLRGRLLPLAAGGLIPALFLAYYNTVNFGSPLRLSYSFAVNYPWAASLWTTFDYPLAAGLQALLFWGQGDGWCGGPCYNQGLLLLSPVVLLAVPGSLWYWREARESFWLTTIVFVAYLLLFSLHRTSHGFTADGRYLAPFLGLLALPAGFALQRLLVMRTRSVLQAVLLLAVYGLFFLSLRNMFLHIGLSYNYDLALEELGEQIAAPANWLYLSRQVIVNLANLPLLWLIEGALLFLVVGVGWLWRRRAAA
jgi:hypothetical protein